MVTNVAPDTPISADARAADRFRDRGRAMLAARQPNAAQAAFRRALALHPDDAAMMVNLATLRPTPREVAAAMVRGFFMAPSHPGVLANLAASHAAAGDCPQALATWRRLALLSPSSSRAALGLTQAWLAGPDWRRLWHGDLARAADWLYRGALIDPRAAIPSDLLNHLALAAKAGSSKARAVRLLRAALARQPDDAEGHATLGIWFCSARSWPAALPCLRRYLILNPSGRRAARVLELLGHAHGNGLKYAAAYRQFLRVLTFDPGRLLALLPHLANAAMSQPLTTRIERLVCTALVAHPGDAVIYQNFGGVISATGQFDTSTRAIRRAVMIDPKIDVRVSLGASMLRQGRPFAAWAYFEAAAAARPDSAEAVFNRAKMRLALGDDMGGINALSARWRVTSFAAPYQLYPSPTLRLPVWQNQPIAGKRFFVWGEQGIGDDVWFAGRLNDFVAAGAEVVFECSPKLAALIARSFPRITVWARGGADLDLRGFDYQLPIGYLTEAFHKPGVSYPSGYLNVDERLVTRLRKRYTASGVKPAIGIAWRSVKPAHHGSFEAPILRWGPVLRQKRFSFISLQYGDTAADIAAAAAAFGTRIHQDPEVDYDGDLQAAAAQIAAVDAVVSIASAPVTMAHGLNRPTWAVLRRSQEDWRYRIDACDTPWLPRCRAFWPRTAENWSEVLAAAAEDLDRFMEAAKN